MMPGSGSRCAIRHRKWWRRSSSVGALKQVIRTPCGSTRPTVCRIVPPLPEVSMPCSTSSTRRVSRVRPSANSRSWRSASSSPRAASAAFRRLLAAAEPGRRVGSGAGEVDGSGGRRISGSVRPSWPNRDRRRVEGAPDHGGAHRLPARRTTGPRRSRLSRASAARPRSGGQARREVRCAAGDWPGARPPSLPRTRAPRPRPLHSSQTRVRWNPCAVGVGSEDPSSLGSSGSGHIARSPTDRPLTSATHIQVGSWGECGGPSRLHGPPRSARRRRPTSSRMCFALSPAGSASRGSPRVSPGPAGPGCRGRRGTV